MSTGYLAVWAAVFAVTINNRADAGAEFDVIREARTGAVVEAMLCVYDRSLTEELATRYLKQFLSEHSERFGLLRLSMVSGYTCPAEYFGDKPREVRRFEEWLEMVRGARQPDSAIAEVLKAPSGTLLRYRSKSGKITKALLQGTDPSIIRQGKTTFEILHLEIVPPAPLFKDRPGGGRRVEIFFRAVGTLTEQECRVVTDEISKNLDLPFLFTHFRPDPFFVFSERFPVIHPLISYPELPSEETYRQSAGIECSVIYQAAHCSAASEVLH